MGFYESGAGFQPMLRLSLHAHPASPSQAVRALRVVLGRDGAGLFGIDYELDAEPARLVMPERCAAGFADGLWRHSCFELFAARRDDAYREFNFSPSSRFAIYDFDHYRRGLRPVTALPPPAIDVHSRGLLVRVRMPAESLAGDDVEVSALAVAAVIEEEGGILSYWALHHPGVRPDFHDRNGFVVSWPLSGGIEEHRC